MNLLTRCQTQKMATPHRPLALQKKRFELVRGQLVVAQKFIPNFNVF